MRGFELPILCLIPNFPPDIREATKNVVYTIFIASGRVTFELFTIYTYIFSYIYIYSRRYITFGLFFASLIVKTKGIAAIHHQDVLASNVCWLSSSLCCIMHKMFSVRCMYIYVYTRGLVVCCCCRCSIFLVREIY